MRSRSSVLVIFEVAWRSKASTASSRVIPQPSSETRRRRRPPASTSTSTRSAPASIEFSTNSFATEAGRSTTSPAAIWFATWSERTRIFDMGKPTASEINNKVIVRREVYRVVNPLDGVEAVAREQGGDVDVSLLQGTLGVEGRRGAFELAKRGAVALNPRAMEARAKAVELVSNLFASAAKRFRERRVEVAKARVERVERAVDGRVGL